MDDPVLRLARQRAERLVDDTKAIEREFSAITEWRPVLSIMKLLRDQAAEALTALADVDPEKPAVIRALQNKVHLFSDFVVAAKQIYDAGVEAAIILDAADQEELADVSGIGTAEERAERASTRNQSYDDD